MFVHLPAFYLLVVLAISLFLPLASLWLSKPSWVTRNSALVGLITAALSVLTALGGELAHAAATHADFSWRAWASTAITVLILAMPVAHSKIWKGTTAADRALAAGNKDRH